jgi:hypothetical protein
MHRFFKKTILIVTLCEVLLVTLSLFWCGDADCWSGTSDDQCSSLICSLFANHPESNEGGGAASECSCVCHLPTMLARDVDTNYHPPVVSAGIEATMVAPSAPSRPIYHPPLTS